MEALFWRYKLAESPVSTAPGSSRGEDKLVYGTLIGIPRNQKLIKDLSFNFIYIHFLNNIYYFCPHLDFTCLCNDYPIESCKSIVILFCSMLPNVSPYIIHSADYIFLLAF